MQWKSSITLAAKAGFVENMDLGKGCLSQYHKLKGETASYWYLPPLSGFKAA